MTFCLDGAMDDESAAEALRRLGAGFTPPAASTPPGGSPSGGRGRWLACGLRSDGVIELWPEPDTPGSSEGWNDGSLERQLDAAGLPYTVYRP